MVKEKYQQLRKLEFDYFDENKVIAVEKQNVLINNEVKGNQDH